MGADLYLESVFRAQHERHGPRFKRSVRRRDRARTAAARERAQQQVDRSFEAMHADGYFRDYYNSTSLLWLFELSWWADIGPLLEESEAGRMLSTSAAARLLSLLREREDVFARQLRRAELENSEAWPEIRSYFEDKYARLQAFLTEAIRRGEAIRCSI